MYSLKNLQYKSLQNKSDWDKDKPTICIEPNNPIWPTALNNWVNGLTPTDSKEWKSGVYMTFK